MYEFMKKPSSDQKKNKESFPRTSKSKTRETVIQRVELNLKTPGSDKIWTVDTRGSGAGFIPRWIEESAKTQPQEIHEFIRQLSSSKKLNQQENFFLNYARALLRPEPEAKTDPTPKPEEKPKSKADRLIEQMIIIAVDEEKHYPYSGFLSIFSFYNRNTSDKSPLVKELGMSERKKPGMNCWGAILFAAYQAGLLTKETMLYLDEIDSESNVPRLLQNPDKTLDITESDLKSYSFPKGCIISLAALSLFDLVPGKHVFLSLGGTGLETRIVEVDQKERGVHELKVVLDRYNLIDSSDPKAQSTKPQRKIRLYLYSPDWLSEET